MAIQGRELSIPETHGFHRNAKIVLPTLPAEYVAAFSRPNESMQNPRHIYGLASDGVTMQMMSLKCN